MGFYDSVKDDVRDEHGSGDSQGDGGEENVGFDQLKKDAEDKEEPGEADPSSDADIEVLGEGEVPDTGQEEESQEEIQETGGALRQEDREPGPVEDGPGDHKVAEILNRIEEQNREMLSVLRGIKRSLE